MKEKSPYIKYNKSNKEFAKENRKNMTKAEQKIRFELLQHRLVWYKFIRQKMIGSFILDFYCAKLLLWIEIDGNSHDDKQTYDEIRTSLLNNYWIKIIRYTNEQVYKHLEAIYEDLMYEIWIREKHYLVPPDKEGAP